MSSRRKDTREKIFEIYSKNLQIVKSHPEIRFEPDFKNAYICPICFEPFDRNALLDSHQNQLTIEDVPPKSLGGNPKILTCKKCNSFCGHEMDNHLLKRLEEEDCKSFLPNSSFKTTYKSENGEMNGLVEIDEKGKISLKFEDGWSNPSLAKTFMKECFPPRTYYNPLFNFKKSIEPYQTNNFTIRFPNYSIERRAEIALLKTAYLLAFAVFGNSFLINGNLYEVREQILNPEKPVLPSPFRVKHLFPDEVIGINLIKSPKELRCFLIVFNLKTKSAVCQFAIALPGFSSPGIDIYKNLNTFLYEDSPKEKIHFEFEHLNDFDFIKEESNVWAAHWFWQKHCQDK